MNIEELEEQNKPKHKIGHIVYYHTLAEDMLCIIKRHCGSANNLFYYDLICIETQDAYHNVSEYDITPFSSHTREELKDLAKSALMSIYNENKDTFDKSLTVNSIDTTINHAQEELSELIEELSEASASASKMIKQLNHYRRDRINASKIKEEVYDCYIILTELMLLFDDEPNKTFKTKLDKYKHSIDKKWSNYNAE